MSLIYWNILVSWWIEKYLWRSSSKLHDFRPNMHRSIVTWSFIIWDLLRDCINWDISSSEDSISWWRSEDLQIPHLGVPCNCFIWSISDFYGLNHSKNQAILFLLIWVLLFYPSILEFNKCLIILIFFIFHYGRLLIYYPRMKDFIFSDQCAMIYRRYYAVVL